MITCPHCHSSLNLEQLTEDAAARHLFALIAQSNSGPAFVAYLGLFKPGKQALRWTRAVALAEEILERWGTDGRLGPALVKTVEALREKRQTPEWRPLSNHNYLASVLEGIPLRAALAAGQVGVAAPRKTRDISIEEHLRDTSWAD